MPKTRTVLILAALVPAAVYACVILDQAWNPTCCVDVLRFDVVQGGGSTLADTGETVSQLLGDAVAIWEACSSNDIGPRITKSANNPHWKTYYLPYNNWSAAAKNICSSNSCGCYVPTNETSGFLWLNKGKLGTSACPSLNVMIHEMGHTFGMKHVNCSNHIMQDTAQYLEQPTWDECLQTANSFETTYEYQHPQLNNCYPNPWCATPLVLDLDGAGIITAPASHFGVEFDIDADGQKEEIGWLGEQNHDAFLWMDLNNNRRVDSGAELFGSASTDPRGVPFNSPNGFEVLGFYDDPDYGGNGDGVIDRADAVWSRLWVWEDRDRNGESSPQEIKPIQRHQIAKFDLRYTMVEELDSAQNWRVARGVFWIRAGRSLVARPVEDIAFNIKK